jgi:hypothetical protein
VLQGVLKASSGEYCEILCVLKRRLRGTQGVLGRARARYLRGIDAVPMRCRRAVDAVPMRCRRGADAVLAEFSRGFRGIQRVPRGYSGYRGCASSSTGVSGARACASVCVREQ